MRLLLVKWHKWLGLCGCGFLLFQALSGSLLVFRAPVENALQDLVSDRQFISGAVNIDRVVQRLDTEWPHFSITRIRYSREEAPYLLVRLQNDISGAYKFVAVDGAGQEPVSSLDMSHGLMFWVFRLHENLALGSLGRMFNVLMGAVLLFMAVTGVYFWWPLRARQKLKITWKAPAKRRWYDVHRVFGVFLVPFIFVLVVTGVGMSVRLLSLKGAPPANVNSEHALPWAALNPALSRIEAHRNIQEIRFNHRNLKASVLLETENPAWPGGRDKANLSLRDGQETGVVKTVDAGLSQQLLGWLYPLHSKLALGGFGQLMLVLSGVFLMAIIFSGVRLWWVRKFS